MHMHTKAFFKSSIFMFLMSFFIVALIMLATCDIDTHNKRIEVRKIACKEQLKGIYGLMQSYKAEFNIYPDMFVSLPTYKRDARLFVCPNSLMECEYEYQPKNNIYFHDKIPIIWDKRDFHLNYGNVLFKDGTIQALDGKEWEVFLKCMEKNKVK